MRKTIITACMLMSGATALKAQVAPKYSNEFLAIGVGARAAALGGANIASVDDVTSGYWNPAGLLSVKDNIQIALMHNEQFAGIAKNDYGAIAFRLNQESVISLSMIRLGVDDIPNTLNLMQNGQIDYSRISSFSSVDYGFIGSYARTTKIEGLTAGANVKVIRRIVGDFANAWGFGFDIGAQYRKENLRLGAMFRDITSTFNAWTYTFTPEQLTVLKQTNNKLPENNLELTLPKFMFGAAYKFEFFKKRFTVLPELNFDITTDGQRNVVISSKYVNIDPRMGLELGYADIVYLRGGMNNFQEERNIGETRTHWTFVPTIGAGIKVKNLCIDYALSDIGNVSSLPYSNIISLRLGINRKT